MDTSDLQTKRQRHIEELQVGDKETGDKAVSGEEVDDLFINNPDHPLKAHPPGNQTEEVDHVEGQDHKQKLNPADAIPDDINTRER